MMVTTLIAYFEQTIHCLAPNPISDNALPSHIPPELHFASTKARPNPWSAGALSIGVPDALSACAAFSDHDCLCCLSQRIPRHLPDPHAVYEVLVVVSGHCAPPVRLLLYV